MPDLAATVANLRRLPVGVDQSRFAVPDGEGHRQGVPYGDCWRAAVATLLGFPLDGVPDFALFTWGAAAQELWARALGLTVENWSITEERPIPAERCLVTGKTIRGTSHVCVYEGGALAWDPHPSRAGISEPKWVDRFVPWDHATASPCWVCGQRPDAADYLREKNEIIKAYAGPTGMTPEDVREAVEERGRLREAIDEALAQVDKDSRGWGEGWVGAHRYELIGAVVCAYAALRAALGTPESGRG